VQDALTHIEEAVYDFLWGAKTAEPYKMAAAGYAEISKSARIAKRNAPAVVERRADILTRQPTQYRVRDFCAAHGWGKGNGCGFEIR
jgi:hypothetical protein